MTARIAVAAALLVAALALAQPVRDRLAPPAPLSSAAGAGDLAGSVLAGSFRPLLLTYLWLRGDVLYGEGRDAECYELYRLLHALYPDNERARNYLGWFLAFNLILLGPYGFKAAASTKLGCEVLSVAAAAYLVHRAGIALPHFRYTPVLAAGALTMIAVIVLLPGAAALVCACALAAYAAVVMLAPGTVRGIVLDILRTVRRPAPSA